MNLPSMQLTSINGIGLETIDRGTGDSVVFIHGSMGDECFAVLEEPVLADRSRLIHYHRRGWGRSEIPEVPVTIQQQVADFRTLLNHFGIEKTHLVGQSYGAIISLQIVLDVPEVVHSLALLEPPLPSSTSAPRPSNSPLAKSAAMYEAGDKIGAMQIFSRAACGDDFRERFDQTLPPGHYERWLGSADVFFRSDLPALSDWMFTSEDAERITQPVLNMRGVDSSPFAIQVFDTLASWLPHAENFVLPNTNHCMLQLNPKDAATRLARFHAKHAL